MGEPTERIDDRLRAFIEAQKVFFVATAPVGPSGHVNVSPKGLSDTFAVLDPVTVAYLDLTGSGAETIAHLRQNARITLMFCAFEGPPRIVRLYGTGEVVLPGTASWDQLSALFPGRSGARAVVRVALERVSSSCGYGVPLYSFQAERDQLERWSERKGPDGLATYRRDKNSSSIDGLPALSPTGDWIGARSIPR
jgi:hypothetical protein